MSTRDWFFSILEAAVWYLFIYYLLYTVKTPVNLWQSSLVLLLLAYIGTITCPWFRQTTAWRRLFQKNN